MKRYLLLIISIVCLAASAQEQSGAPRRPRMTPEEFQTKQKEFIAIHAELTEEESATFFPLYFELQDKKFSYNKEMWSKIRKTKEGKNITDAEYSRLTEDVIKTRITIDELELEYLHKYKKVLSPKKIYDIQRAEMKFSRELLKGAGKHNK